MHAELSWAGRTGTVTVGGAAVAAVERALLRERADVQLDGSNWIFASHRGVITAEDSAGAVRHTARGEGACRRRWTLTLADRPVPLERVGSGHWRLADGEVRASVRGTVVAQLPDGTTADAAAFVLWVADVLTRRAGGGAA